MHHFVFKLDITWRDVVQRVLLILATTLIIVWFMPRESRIDINVELGKPWRSADLTAPFDFPVYKSEAVISAERDSVLRDYEPYYILHKQTSVNAINNFVNAWGQSKVLLSAEFRNVIVNRLGKLYEKGIVDTKEPVGGDRDTIHALRIVDGKIATSLPARHTLTAMQAYEQLLADPVLSTRLDALQSLNLNNYIVPNLIYDVERSEASKQELLNTIPLASGIMQRGQMIIARGAIVDEHTYAVIESYNIEKNRRMQTDSQFTTTVLGELVYMLLLITGFTIFLSLSREAYFENLRSVGMLYSLIIVFAVLSSLLVGHNMFHVFIIPYAIVAIFIRVFMDSRTAFMTHLVLVLICACMLQRPLDFVAVQTMAGMAAIFSLRDLSSRSQLLWTAIAVTVSACLTKLSLDLIATDTLANIDLSAYYYLFFCGVVLFCSYPLLYIMEKTFGYTSNITLIELSDMNKDLLRRMSEVAPGTFQHSIQVSNLAAEIGRKIGANAQLLRTGALYHDIGKIQNPIYFTENQSGGINPHDHLSCMDSANIIISHVTEGLKLADKYNLPDVLKQFIATHHGQGKAKYFYVKWKNEHPDEEVDELLFTYPGPNPFTKEQAILMMADAIEAASRSLSDYTEQTIRTLVNRIIDSMVTEGYFRECPITFRDIAYAKTVLIEKLKTIYHTRISYPQLKNGKAESTPSNEEQSNSK